MKNSEDALNPLIWVIITGVALSRLGLSLSVPFITLFLHKSANLNLFYAGLVVATSFVTYIFGGIIGGVLSDFIGRKNLLLSSVFFYSLVFLGFGVSSALVHNKWSLVIIFFVLNSLAGLCRSWSETLGQAMIADICNFNQKRKAFSYRYIAANIGAALGPLIGVFFGISGASKGFYFTGIILLLYFLLFSIMMNVHRVTEFKDSRLSLKEIFSVIIKDKKLRYFIIAGGLIYFGYVQQEAVFGIIIQKELHSPDLLAILLSINAIMVIILQVPLSRFTGGIAPLKIMMIGAITLAMGLVIIGLAQQVIAWYIVGEVFFTLGEMLIMPLNGVVTDSLAPAKLRGTYFGAVGFQYIGRALGPIVGGVFIDKFGGGIAMSLIALITLISIFFYYMGFILSSNSGRIA